MPILKPGELLQVLIDSCRRTTEAVLYLEGHNPFRLSVNGSTYTIFVANVSPATRANPDEYRIQCPGDLPDSLASRQSFGETICVLGYHSDSGVFSAWDPSLFLTRSRMVQRFSIYTRLSSIWDAHSDGIAKYVDSDRQTVLLLRSEYLSLYLENSEIIHNATDRALRNIVDVYGETRPGAVPVRRVFVGRRKIEVTHVLYGRSPQFRQEVLSAYGNRCAMCGVQLELIEAAHLVPHAHPKGIDVVENGVALCALHHRSLDTGLLYIDSDYSIQMNDVRYRYLARMKLTEGLNRYKRYLSPEIVLPGDPSKHPLKDNIVLGNRLRGIGVN